MTRLVVWVLVLAACSLLVIRYLWDEHRALTIGTADGIQTLWWAAIWGCPT